MLVEPNLGHGSRGKRCQVTDAAPCPLGTNRLSPVTLFAPMDVGKCLTLTRVAAMVVCPGGHVSLIRFLTHDDAKSIISA